MSLPVSGEHDGRDPGQAAALATSSSIPISSDNRSTSPIASITPHDNETEPTAEEPSSRRALVSSAMDSIQRFKQSWVSIMFLKAGVGLGQVVALIVLLILAAILPSPLAPHAKQIDGSDACPHPGLFQAWMIVQIFRLTICWSVSCWVAVRAQRVVRRQAQREAQEEARIEPYRQAAERTRRDGELYGSQPSLSHSASTGSATTLAGYSSATHDRNGSSPPFVYVATVQSSSTTVDMLGRVESKEYQQPGRFVVTQAAVATAGVPAQRDAAVPRTSLQQARELVRIDTAPSEAVEETPVTGFAGLLDSLAPLINKILGLVSLVLFILGNVLVFYPLPNKQDTCYHASPMLWWGVMTVTGVGWFLFGQILFVVLVVGLGGQAVLALLRRLHIVPTPPQPEPPRPPQPDPLTRQELAKLRIVCFVPHPDPPSSPPSPTELKSMADQQSAPSKEGEQDTPVKWDMTRFPYPPHWLKANKTLCAICQDNFVAPQVIRRILYDAEPLRLLNCGHVYHADCVDKWLTEKSGICPTCNTAVRDTLPADKTEKEAGAGKRWWSRSR